MAAKKTTAKPAAKTAIQQAPPVQPTEFFSPGFLSQNWLPLAVLMAASFVFYGLTLGFGYIQDDQLYIWDNAFVQKGFAGLAEIFGNDSLLGYYKDPKLMLEGGRYRPLPLATFAIEIGIFGKNCTAVAHFFNVLFYGLTGCLLFRVLSGLFPPSPRGQWFFGLPFLAALVFMLHPLHTEVVCNIKSRDEIFALLFSLAALWAMMKHFDTLKNSWRWLAAGFFLLGLFSKENTATFLAVIPLAVWMFSRQPLGRVLFACAPMLVSVLLFLLMRAAAIGKNIAHPDELVLNPFFGMSSPEKMGTILLSLGWHLKLLFWPAPLTIDYYPYHVPKVGLTDFRAMISLVLVAGLGVWAYRELRKTRVGEGSAWAIPAFSALYFLLTISVVSNVFVRTSTFLNERYLFMPSVGFCLFVAWLAARKLPETSGQQPDRANLRGGVLAAVVGLVFAWLTFQRVPDWGGDGSKLVESAVKTAPNSYRANYYYANLLNQTRYLKIEKATDEQSVAERKNLLDSMDFYLNRALEINPGYRLAAPLKIQTAVARYNQDKDLEKLLKDLETLVTNQPANGEMLTMALNVLKSLKGSDPNKYNFFCHRVGYAFYFRKMKDNAGALEFLNLGLANFPGDKNMIQDLMEVYGAMGNQAKVAQLRQQLGMVQ